MKGPDVGHEHPSRDKTKGGRGNVLASVWRDDWAMRAKTDYPMQLDEKVAGGLIRAFRVLGEDLERWIGRGRKAVSRLCRPFLGVTEKASEQRVCLKAVVAFARK